nr:retrovirus-related Pol polyprotein from transposon TNT 1-94 [Tanacetum cinerariifolium]
FVEKFLGTVKFGNDQITPILVYGDLVQGAVTIKRVYYVEGLNHNLFSVGQFCDADLEVAFRKSTCFIRDLKGNDLLSDHLSSDPAPECQTMALNHDSLSLANQRQVNVTQADRTVTTSNELDLLFSPMFDELLNGSSKVVSQSSVVSAADAPNQRQQYTTPLTNHTTPAPTSIAISCNPVQHSRTKHIDVRYHFIKKKVEKGIVELFFVRTEYQLADLFTKALPVERFQYLVRRLVHNSVSNVLGECTIQCAFYTYRREVFYDKESHSVFNSLW